MVEGLSSEGDLTSRGYWGGVWFYRVMAMVTWPLLSFPAAIFGLRYAVLAALLLFAFSVATWWRLRRYDLPIEQLKIANVMLGIASGSLVIAGTIALIRLGWYHS